MELAGAFAWSMLDAATPFVRDELALDYVQVGILASVPHIVGSLLEVPVGLLGDGTWRRRLIVWGGLLFVAALVAFAYAPTFTVALFAMTVLSPSAGCVFGLSQACWADAHRDHPERAMTWWSMAAAAGSLIGPVLLGVAATSWIGWSGALVVAAVVTLGVLVAIRRLPLQARGARAANDRGTWREVVDADVLVALVPYVFLEVGFGVWCTLESLFLFDELGFTPGHAAFLVSAGTAAGLVGNLVVERLFERFAPAAVVSVGCCVATPLAVLTLVASSPFVAAASFVGFAGASAGWYAYAKGRLYRALGDRSGAAMSVTSAVGVFACGVPAGAGFLAQRTSMRTALAVLGLIPFVLFGVVVSVASRSGTGPDEQAN